MAGSSSLQIYNGRALAASNDVIVASINYRLMAFGFLSTGDHRIRGKEISSCTSSTQYSLSNKGCTRK